MAHSSTSTARNKERKVRLLLLGDAAVTVQFGNEIDPALNERVLTCARTVLAQRWEGILDVVPTYCALTVHVDPLRLDLSTLLDRLRRLIAGVSRRALPAGRRHTIPVLYGSEGGPDLADLAAFARLSVAEAIRLHSSVLYRVYMLGFTPGFPYLGSVPGPLAMPRLPAPRAAVPAGSVGIAGHQTGIYPTSTPGGWRLIGRTPVPLYRPDHPSPFLLCAGDLVRFVPIGRREFDVLEREAQNRTH
jgi:KipI family sensor histidine kinase inhibitor